MLEHINMLNDRIHLHIKMSKSIWHIGESLQPDVYIRMFYEIVTQNINTKQIFAGTKQKREIQAYKCVITTSSRHLCNCV